MNASPVSVRVRSPMPSPRHAASSPSSNPRSPLQQVRRNLSTGNPLIGPSLLVRMILPCALPLLIVSQWMLQLERGFSVTENYRYWGYNNYDSSSDHEDPATLRNNSDDQEPRAWHSHLSRDDASWRDGPAAEAPQYSFPFVKDSSRPLPVAWLAVRQESDAESTFSATAVTWLDDAVDRSKYIRLAQRIVYTVETRNVTIYNLEGETEPLVYVVDWASLQRDCHVLRAIVDHCSRDAMNSPIRSFLVYYDSSHSDRVIQCREVDKRFLAVKYAKQSLVRGRYWNRTERWIEPGSLNTNSLDTTSSLIFAPTTLDEEFVTRLDNILASRKQANVFKGKRRTDVSILARYGSHAGYTFFRSHVTNAIMQESGRKTNPYSARALGDPTELVNNDTLIHGMLDSKIVVVAHPDEWQDSVNILKAMASGALVFCDEPPFIQGEGFLNGTNIIFYENLEKLRSLLAFYIKSESSRRIIAKKGWEFAMGMRRAWQGMELVLFGSPGTHAGQPESGAPSKRHG